MRLRLFQIVQRAQNNDQVSRWYDFFIVAVAFVSIVPLMFKSEQITPEFDRFLNMLDILTVFILFSDYVFRWITYDIKSGLGKKSFIIYPFTPMAIIDLLSILPSVTILHDSFKFLRILRIVRILRMFNGLTIMTNVFIRERKALLSIIFFMCVYVLAIGLIMFTIEPDTFNTFLDALYWSTTALATIGYGDITPVTDLGKFLAIVSSLVGIAVVAFPAGIITGGYITQLQKAREKGIEYFALPVRHDKVFKGKPISKYKNAKSYFKANKKVKYYFIWIAIGVVISSITTLLFELFPSMPIYFEEYGTVIIAIVLEPCAGIFVALINDVLYSIYSGTAFTILTFGVGAMYAVVFGIYFRRGRKITTKSILLVLLVCVVLNSIYMFITMMFVMSPEDLVAFSTEHYSYDAVLELSLILHVDINIAVILLFIWYKVTFAIIGIITVILIRNFFWGSMLDPMLKIPKRKRYKYKVYKKAKNEHSYIQTWLDQNTDEDEDIPEFDAVVAQGKKSIAKSKKTIKEKQAAIEEMQQEVQEKIADIATQREEIAKHEEAIDVKRRAVRRVRRKQIIEESDFIPNILSGNTNAESPNAPGADSVGSNTDSFAPISINDTDKNEEPKHKASD